MKLRNGIISESNSEPGSLNSFLAALTGRDRRLIPPCEGATTVAIAGGDGRSHATFPVEAFLEARRRGYIATDGGGTGQTRITRAGREALRRHRSNRVAERATTDDRADKPLPAATPAQNIKESPLTWLASRRDATGRAMLAPWEVEAGERLRADLTFAQLTPRITMGWSGIPMGAKRTASMPRGGQMTDNIVAARARVTSALRAVGPEFVDILIDVCGHLRGLEEIARSEGWPRRAARLLLQRALSALARHYGLGPEPRVEERISRRLRHWGAEDYKPSLDRWQTPDDHGD
jgi:hypothetical protein